MVVDPGKLCNSASRQPASLPPHFSADLGIVTAPPVCFRRGVDLVEAWLAVLTGTDSFEGRSSFKTSVTRPLPVPNLVPAESAEAALWCGIPHLGHLNPGR